MNGEKLVPAITTGSPKLDEMRREIDTVLGTSLHVSNKLALQKTSYVRPYFETSRLHWKIERRIGTWVGKKYILEAYELKASGARDPIYESVMGAGHILMQFVPIVRSDLHAVLDQLQARFGDFDTDLEPLINAAAAAKPEPKVRRHRMVFGSSHPSEKEVEINMKREVGDVQIKKQWIEERTSRGATVIIAEYVES